MGEIERHSWVKKLYDMYGEQPFCFPQLPNDMKVFCNFKYARQNGIIKKVEEMPVHPSIFKINTEAIKKLLMDGRHRIR